MITERPGAVDLPEGSIGVRLRDVRFTYPRADQVSLASLEDVAVLDHRGGQEVLHGIDLEVGPGRLLALVGPSGAGKSTIATLVPRLYDVDGGAVELAGIDVRDLTFAAVRGAVGVVTQDGHLFHDTIAANLRYAAPDATDAELIHALHRARLGELLATLPDGLDTVVGEGGFGLSGGQAQRVAIARAFLKNAPLLLLDEPTAHLDPATEGDVLESLRRLTVGRTVVMASHAAAAHSFSARRLDLRDGRLVQARGAA